MIRPKTGEPMESAPEQVDDECLMDRDVKDTMGTLLLHYVADSLAIFQN